MGPVLELRDLAKHYPGQRAVDGISLAIPEGGFFSLLGPSGCGKTTTLRLIAGFEEPTSGHVLLRGNIVNGCKPYERNVSTVFQSYALFPHLTARGNVEFGLKRRRAPEIGKRVSRVLELVGLEGKQESRPAHLSGGERQRVALARSLVLEPDVLLLDEPLAALDPKLRKQMRLELKSMQQRVGITFLLVTHDQEEALSMSDQIAVMNAGKVEQMGAPEEVYLRPRTPFVAGFLGAVNWIGSVGVRPERTRVAIQPPPDGARSRPAVVTGTVFLGDCIHVLTKLLSGEAAVAQVSRDEGRFRAGDTVHVSWDADDEMTFS
jgi:ABC-type Fe3+/spermidine/putrescine transport system ATPase subunit